MTSNNDDTTSGGDTRILTSREVAARYNVNVKTVARWAADGKIPHFRTPGGHIRVRETALGDPGTPVSAPQPGAYDLPPADAAGMLRVSEPTLHRMVATGQLTAIRTPGGHRRYSRHEIAAFMARTNGGKS